MAYDNNNCYEIIRDSINGRREVDELTLETAAIVKERLAVLNRFADAKVELSGYVKDVVAASTSAVLN
jgi:hypothetical protein